MSEQTSAIEQTGTPIEETIARYAGVNPNPQPEWLPRLKADMDKEVDQAWENGGDLSSVRDAAVALAASYLHEKDDHADTLAEKIEEMDLTIVGLQQEIAQLTAAKTEQDATASLHSELRHEIRSAVWENDRDQSIPQLRVDRAAHVAYEMAAKVAVKFVRRETAGLQKALREAEATIAARDRQVEEDRLQAEADDAENLELRQRLDALTRQKGALIDRLRLRETEGIPVLVGAAGGKPKVAPEPAGAWVAAFSDLSSVAVFGSEVECLRYAVEHSMGARLVPFGATVEEAFRG